MRVAFFGTPDFAATILEELAQHHEVVMVYTRPDAIRKRGSILVPSPVKEMAQRFGLPVCTPETLRSTEVLEELKKLNPQVICVAAYGALLPREILELPNKCINIHASLLPRWRGAAPVERAILAGDDVTGVSIMQMEEGLDTGPYCVCRSVEIADFSAEQLTSELANLGAHALLSALALIEVGKDEWTAQNENQVLYAKKIAKGELFIDPKDSVSLNTRRIQASSAMHPSRCRIGARNVTLHWVRPDARSGFLEELDGSEVSVPPGRVRLIKKKLYLGCVDGPLELHCIQPDGKRPMEASAFAAGLQGLKSGEVTWSHLDV